MDQVRTATERLADALGRAIGVQPQQAVSSGATEAIAVSAAGAVLWAAAAAVVALDAG